MTESLAGKAEMAVLGRTNQDMESLNKSMDLKLLHGATAYGFPNLLLTSPGQAGVGVNQVQRLEEQSKHLAYIIAEAERRAGSGKKAVIEPTEEACAAWGDTIASAAHLTSAMAQCTPGYFTLEGDVPNIPPEVFPKMARMGFLGQGYRKFEQILRAWRKEGHMEGVTVQGVAA
jgi:hypothetical protein